jgi:hypothetical protein
MQVIFPPNLTCTPPHFAQASFIKEPPLSSSEAADLNLELSSDIKTMNIRAL